MVYKYFNPKYLGFILHTVAIQLLPKNTQKYRIKTTIYDIRGIHPAHLNNFKMSGDRYGYISSVADPDP
jgi:hypothetical protein